MTALASVISVVKVAAPPQRLQSGGREIPPMAELLGKRLKTSQSFVKVSEKQPYDMMDTNGYWPWSDPAKLSVELAERKGGRVAAGEMKKRKQKMDEKAKK